MKLQTMAAIAGLTFGVSAFAIPKFDGDYTCTNGGQSSPVTLKTSGDQLFVTGIDTGLGPQSQGIPCSNETKSQAVQGNTISMKTSCDAKSLGFELSVSGAQTAKLSMKFDQVSDKQVKISVHVVGNGQDVSGAVDCTKN